MPTVSPGDCLWLLLGATALAWVIHYWRDQARMRRMAHWAAQAQLFYSPTDLLGLAPRVARLLPFPGPAQVRVTDLMYRSDGEFHHCIFTVEYTRGVMSHRHRVVQVAGLHDPIARRDTHAHADLRTAPAGLPRMEQYRHLLAQIPQITEVED